MTSLVRSSPYSSSGSDDKQMDLEGHLSLLCDCLPPSDSEAAVDTLIKIVQNAIDHPGEEHYRRLKTSNKTFSQRVWKHPSAQDFMIASGWVELDGDVVLPSDDRLQVALVELTKTRSSLQPHSAQDVVRKEHSTASHQASPAHERMRRLREAQRKTEEEKKRIAEQISADRRETSKRESKPSHGRELKSGGKLNRFEDIGVDLNAGGG